MGITSAGPLIFAEANAPDDAAIRLVIEDEGFSLGIDIVRPSDTTFDHEGKVILAIDELVLELLADMHLDVQVTGEEPVLIQIDQLCGESSYE